MEWLLILGLGVWVLLQSRRIAHLARRLAELERRIGAAAPARPGAPVPSPAAPALEPLLLDTPLGADELVLDTPLPEVSNDEIPVAPAPAAAPGAPVLKSTRRTPWQVGRDTRRLEQWLAQNGLAWLGGAALALGAIYFVSVAAKQNWFTPPVQIASALALSALLLAAGEWARAASRARPPGHPLIAALLASAGCVALYATVWAAHGLYGFVGVFNAALLLTLCSAILVGLAFLHGEALSVLAIAAALLAPPLTHAALWPDTALTLYVFAVGAAGLMVATLRRAPWTSVATMAGLYFWFAAAIAADDVRRAMALLICASTGGFLLAFRPHLRGEADNALSWRRVHAWLPGVAIAISSVLLIWTWLALAAVPSGLIAGPAWVGVIFVALAAAVRARVAAPAAIPVSVCALVLGFAAYLRARYLFGPLGDDFYPAILFASAGVAASALFARAHRSARVMTAIAGAGGGAILTLLAASSRADWHSLQAWAALFAGAGILFAAAWRTSRTAQNGAGDRAVDVWAGAAALLALVGVESAFAEETRHAACAVAALLFAAGLRWGGARMLGPAALLAAAVSIAHALSPNLLSAALSGAIPIWVVLAALAASAAFLLVAGLLAKPAHPRGVSEALNSAALVMVLIGVFLCLRWFAAAGAPARLDGFTEAALRALALITAGHIVIGRGDLGFVARWRGHVLMSAGLAYALVMPGLLINPWWGLAPATVVGPAILNTDFIAFAAPAGLALAAAHRLYDSRRNAARIYAVAGAALGLAWVTLELRRLFHGDEMSLAPVGAFEGASYALMLLGATLAIALGARARASRHADGPLTRDLIASVRGCAWTGLAAAAWIMLVAHHPWWGDQAASDALSTGLATLAQAGAVALSLFIGRAVSTSRGPDPSRFAAASAAVLFAWSFGHAAIHYLFGLSGWAPLLECFAHALWPAALVVIAAEVTERAPGRDTIRSYLYDLQAIWGASVWPALGFAALGLWLVFNPWWGALRATTQLEASLAAPVYALGAALSAAMLRVARAPWPQWFARAATAAALGHLLVGLTMLVRRAYHGEAFAAAPSFDVELWTYSAVWALFGGMGFWLGVRRADATLRWSGLAVLIATAAYVFFLAFTRLTGFVQAGSMLGLAAVLLIVAWLARAYRPATPGSDLVNAAPAARRERRYGRR
jgi:uncharacterized membrane protein